jgi:hypothetical protein
MDLIELINYTYSKINIYYGLIVCYDESIIKSIHDILKEKNYPVHIFKTHENMEELKYKYRLFLVYSKHLNNFNYFSDISVVFTIKRNVVYIFSNKELPYNHTYYDCYDNRYYTSCFYINI